MQLYIVIQPYQTSTRLELGPPGPPFLPGQGLSHLHGRQLPQGSLEHGARARSKSIIFDDTMAIYGIYDGIYVLISVVYGDICYSNYSMHCFLVTPGWNRDFDRVEHRLKFPGWVSGPGWSGNPPIGTILLGGLPMGIFCSREKELRTINIHQYSSIFINTHQYCTHQYS